MEAVGVAVGVVGILDRIASVKRELSQYPFTDPQPVSKPAADPAKDTIEWTSATSKDALIKSVQQLSLLQQILIETQSTLLDQVSPAISGALLDCDACLEAVVKAFGSKKQSEEDMMELVTNSLSRFRESVLLLHQIASSTTASSKLNVMQQSISLLAKAFGEVASSGDDHESSLPPGKLAVLVESRERVKLMTDFLDEKFVLNAILVGNQGTETIVVIPVRCFLDTGSDSFFIDEKLARHSALKHHIKPVEQGYSFHGLGKSVFEPTEFTTLRWHLPGQRKSQESIFYLVKNAPFDLLIPPQVFSVLSEQETQHPLFDLSDHLETGRVLLTQRGKRTAAEKLADEQKQIEDRAEQSRDFLRTHQVAAQTAMPGTGTPPIQTQPAQMPTPIQVIPGGGTSTNGTQNHGSTQPSAHTQPVQASVQSPPNTVTSTNGGSTGNGQLQNSVGLSVTSNGQTNVTPMSNGGIVCRGRRCHLRS